jgi:hypothetical protein
MKTTELKRLWKLIKAGEDRSLAAADLALLLRIWFAFQEYEAKTGQGHPQITDVNMTLSGAPALAG